LTAMLQSCGSAPVGDCYVPGVTTPPPECRYIGPDASPPDSRPPDTLPQPDAPLAMLTCGGLAERAGELASQLARACVRVDDCVPFGAAASCDCSPSLAQGSGFALSKAGYADPELQAIVQLFERRCQACATGACACDAAPALLVCTSGQCTATSSSCLLPPP